jgi:hypothetical protein
MPVITLPEAVIGRLSRACLPLLSAIIRSFAQGSPCIVSPLRHVEDVDQGFANAIVSVIILLISCLTGFGGCVSFFSVSALWTDDRLIIK